MTAASGPLPGADRRRHDRADVLSTSLLLELTTITVDPAYLEVAARRANSGVDERPSRGYTAAALLFLVGFLVVLSFNHTRRGAPGAARARGTLIARIDGLTKQAGTDATGLDALRAQLEAERDRALAAANDDRVLTVSVGVLQFAAGAGPVSGRGVSASLGDAPPTGAGKPARVQDRDVQRLVNIAWSAGAEAVAVNGQRIGALTAIRQAGVSILVDYRPVASPYVVSAIGDPEILETAFTRSSSSSSLRATARSLDFAFDVTRVDHLELAGASPARTSLARPIGATPVEGAPQQ